MSNAIILDNIKDRLKSTLPNDGMAILFGSQARGDAKADSDWDVLVIVDKESLAPQDYDDFTYPLTTLGWDMNVDINPILYTKKEWEASRISPFYHNVTKDGIRIA